MLALLRNTMRSSYAEHLVHVCVGEGEKLRSKVEKKDGDTLNGSIITANAVVVRLKVSH